MLVSPVIRPVDGTFEFSSVQCLVRIQLLLYVASSALKFSSIQSKWSNAAQFRKRTLVSLLLQVQ